MHSSNQVNGVGAWPEPDPAGFTLMRWGLANEGALLACLLSLFVCRAVLAGAIVPPWQGADEPNHFALAKLLTVPIGPWQQNLAITGGVEPTSVAQVEQKVLQSMARHQWWESYSRPVPDPLPTHFAAVADGQNLGAGTYAQPLYYGLGAVVLRVTRPPNLETEYWHLRMLGVMLAVVALALGWAGTRLLFDPLTAIGSTAIAALNPQFLLTSLTVSPDVLVIFCGAFIWWQVAQNVRGRRAFSVVLVLAVAAAALLTDRSALPLAAAAVLAVSVILIMQGYVINRRRTLFALAATIFVTGSVVIMVGLTPFDDWLTSLMTVRNISRPDETTFAAFLRIVPTSLDHVWLVAGWSRFPAPEPWLLLVRVLTVTGFVGGLGLLVQCSGQRRELCLAWLFVVFQLGAVYVLAYRNFIVPHGRLLFPVLLPAAVLFWTGVMWAVPAPARRHAAPILVGLVAALDLTGFTLLLIPSYVL